MKVGVIVSNPGKDVICMSELCSGQVKQFVICRHVEVDHQVVDCCCVSLTRKLPKSPHHPACQEQQASFTAATHKPCQIKPSSLQSIRGVVMAHTCNPRLSWYHDLS